MRYRGEFLNNLKHRSNLMRSKYILILLLFLSQLIILTGCVKKEQTSDKINIVVSIAPLAEFVEKVGGDKVNVSVMVPEGASPHAYEPKPSQLVGVSRADIYVKVGTPIEFELIWIDKLISLNKKMLVIDASENTKLLLSEHEHEHGNHDHEHNHSHGQSADPHVWLSPENAQKMVKNISRGLIKIDPENTEFYKQNTDEYLHELQRLDIEIETKLAEKKNRKFLVYHPAWSYFARQYNLEQISIEDEGKAPTAKGIQRTIETSKKNQIKIVFASPQFDRGNADLIAREIDGNVIFISSMEKAYISNIRNLTQKLFESME